MYAPDSAPLIIDWVKYQSQTGLKKVASRGKIESVWDKMTNVPIHPHDLGHRSKFLSSCVLKVCTMYCTCSCRFGTRYSVL